MRLLSLFGVLLLLSCSVLAERLYDDQIFSLARSMRSREAPVTRNVKRDAAQEIVTSVTGNITNNAPYVVYTISLEAGYYASVTMTSTDYVYAGFQLPYLPEYQTNANTYITGSPMVMELSLHCPLSAAVYYVSLSSYASSNVQYTIAVQRFLAPVVSPAVGTFSGTTDGTGGVKQIPIQVSSTCEALTITVTGSASIDTKLTYKCRALTSYLCSSVTVPGPAIFSNTFSPSGLNSATQHVIPCTTPGNYSLYIYNSNGNYQVTINEGYLCNSTCYSSGGVCDFASGQCLGVTSQGEKQYFDVRTDGQQYTYIVSTAAPIRVLSSPWNPANIIRLTISSDSAVQYTTYTIHFADANATDAASVIIDGNNANQILLVGDRDWYLSYSLESGSLKNVTFSAVVENVDISSKRTFNGSFSGAYTTAIFYFKDNAAFTSYTVFESAPPLADVYMTSGLSSSSSRPYIGSNSHAGVYYDVTYTSGREYYLVITGASGSSFNGSIASSSSEPKCSADCGDNGYCIKTNACTCKLGWTGSTCTTVDASSFSAISMGQTNITLNGRQNFASPAVPTGFALVVSVVGEGVTNVAAALNRLPNEYDPSDFVGTADRDGLAFELTEGSACLPTGSKYYFTMATIYADTRITITLTLEDRTLPNNGSEVSILPRNRELTTYVSYLPSSCASYYTIDVQFVRANVNSLRVSTDCYRSDGLQNTRVSGNYSVTVRVSDCKQPLYLAIDAILSSGNSTTIRITPGGTKCPNDCSIGNYGPNGICSRGKCLCQPSYAGDDCSAIAGVCTPSSDDVSYCGAFAGPVLVGGSYNIDNYCYSVQNDDRSRSSVEYVLNSYFVDNHKNLTATCLAELHQIACDANFQQCVSNPTGGIKLLQPCNCFSFLSRCMPSGDSYLSSYLCGTVSYQLDNTWSVCNPAYPTIIPTKRPSTTGNSATTRTSSNTATTGGDTDGSSTNAPATTNNSPANTGKTSSSGASSRPGSTTTTGQNSNAAVLSATSLIALVFAVVMLL